VLNLHNACVNREADKVKEYLTRNPSDYYTVNWLRSNCSVLQSTLLGGSLAIIAYLKPRTEELEYMDAEGNTAVHYAARSGAADKTELLRYLSFVAEPAYSRDVNALAGIQKAGTVRPEHAVVLPLSVPAHMLLSTAAGARSVCNGGGGGDGTGGQGQSLDRVMRGLPPEQDMSAAMASRSLALRKALDADGRTALTGLGASHGQVVKAGWLSKRGFTTAAMWRPRWVVLTNETLNYYRTEKDTVPRDSLALGRKDCITVEPSQVRANAFDIIIMSGAASVGKQREQMTMLADSEAEMFAWMHALMAVANNDATPLRLTSVRTISPVISDALFSARNSNFDTPLHALCGSNPAEATAAGLSNKTEAEKMLPAAAAWLINRNCPVNSANLKGKSPLYIAIELGRFHLGLVLLRSGASVPLNCAGKDRFLSFVGDENSEVKVIPALQFLPRPPRLRNLHYFSLEILQHLVGVPS
jgi:hypothetical protein